MKRPVGNRQNLAFRGNKTKPSAKIREKKSVVSGAIFRSTYAPLRKQKKAKKGSREKPDYSNSHNAERVVYLRDFIDGVESF